ncbi:YgaP family membrane protein [Roseateles chitosanitabidus]|uniref:YgaP family membrane protein n=1 Tax=Roseateles chitosanitabidus TaxID=65048 RepID=UPI000A06EA9F|nr:DUF2892 domain-containing protein [Roseateles chitosanitabidus]MBO9685683.1 DUF2892 domain-containing protein [Roseateles chitosanitabidus]
MAMNVGTTERLLRVGVGTALTLAAGFGWIGLWGFIGLVPLLTGLAGYCPIYTLFGRGT